MSAGRDLLFFILFLIVLGIAWVWTGGPNRSLSQPGLFLNGQTYSIPSVATSTYATSTYPQTNTPAQNPQPPATTAPPATPAQSPYAHTVAIVAANAQTSDPASEFVVLQTSAQMQSRITISGWVIVSAVTGAQARIGQAAPAPVLGQINTEGPIAVGPSSNVILVSGRSPNGASFRVNECTGYLAQFQLYTPPLTQQCPAPRDELARYPQATNDSACQNFVQNIPQCALTSAIPGNVSASCQDFIRNSLSYNGCVAIHQYDPDFYRNEWRVYLDSSQELWKNTHDTLWLLDENGKLVAQTSY